MMPEGVVLDFYKEKKRREQGLRELEDLKKMVVNWKEAYMRLPKERHGFYLVSEMTEEIGIFMIPYLRRLVVNGYIEPEDADRFIDFCKEQLGELEKFMEKAELEWMLKRREE